MAGVFFQLLTCYLAIKSLNEGWRKAASFGLISGLGLLTYEIALTGIAFALLFLLYNRRFKQVAVWLLCSMASQIVPIIVAGVNLLSWYFYGLTDGRPYSLYLLLEWFSPILRLRQLVLGLSPLMLISFIYAFLQEGDVRRIKMLYMMVVPSLVAFFVWPPIGVRLTLVFIHAVYWMAGLGLKAAALKVSEKPLLHKAPSTYWAVLFVALHVLINNFLAYKWYLTAPWIVTFGPIPGLSLPSLEMLSFKR